MGATIKEARAWLDTFTAAGGFYCPPQGSERGCFGWPPELTWEQQDQLVDMIRDLRGKSALKAKVDAEAKRRHDQRNVVPLPTAAPRKVQYRYNRQYREAKRALPQHPATYISPADRRLLKIASAIADTPRTPEFALLLGMLQAMSPESKAGVVQVLANGTSDTSRQAHALATAAAMSEGERQRLFWAAERYGDV
jgi:hypothetical protein